MASRSPVSTKTFTPWLAGMAGFALLVTACGSDGSSLEAGAPVTGDPDQAVTSPDDPDADTGAADDTGAVDEPVGGAAAGYVGLAVVDAQDLADEQGRPSRVVRIDGEDLAITRDFIADRVNFVTEEGVVIVAFLDGQEDGSVAAGKRAPADGLLPSADYVGLDVDEAGDKADAEEREWRVVMEDGVAFAVTEDFVETRLNLEVDDGVVIVAYTDVEGIGG